MDDWQSTKIWWTTHNKTSVFQQFEFQERIQAWLEFLTKKFYACYDFSQYWPQVDGTLFRGAKLRRPFFLLHGKMSNFKHWPYLQKTQSKINGKMNEERKIVNALIDSFCFQYFKAIGFLSHKLFQVQVFYLRLTDKCVFNTITYVNEDLLETEQQKYLTQKFYRLIR